MSITLEIRNEYSETIKAIDYNFKQFPRVVVDIPYGETKEIVIKLPDNFVTSNYSLLWANYWTIYFEDSSAMPLVVNKVDQNILINVNNNNLVWKMRTK